MADTMKMFETAYNTYLAHDGSKLITASFIDQRCQFNIGIYCVYIRFIAYYGGVVLTCFNRAASRQGCTALKPQPICSYKPAGTSSSY